jgi:hypothetical protein
MVLSFCTEPWKQSARMSLVLVEALARANLSKPSTTSPCQAIIIFLYILLCNMMASAPRFDSLLQSIEQQCILLILSHQGTCLPIEQPLLNAVGKHDSLENANAVDALL